jgi:hypothetical protein
MSEEHPPAEGEAYVSFATAWREPNGTLVPVHEKHDGDNPPDGQPVLVLEIPPVIAYELGWALGLYSLTLADANANAELEPETKSNNEKRSAVMKELSDHINEAVREANTLVNENWATPYTFNMEEVPDA